MLAGHSSSAGYFDILAIIATPVYVGNLLEYTSKGKASEDIRKLMNLQSRAERVVRDGRTTPCAPT